MKHLLALILSFLSLATYGMITDSSCYVRTNDTTFSLFLHDAESDNPIFCSTPSSCSITLPEGSRVYDYGLNVNIDCSFGSFFCRFYPSSSNTYYTTSSSFLAPLLASSKCRIFISGNYAIVIPNPLGHGAGSIGSMIEFVADLYSTPYTPQLESYTPAHQNLDFDGIWKDSSSVYYFISNDSVIAAFSPDSSRFYFSPCLSVDSTLEINDLEFLLADSINVENNYQSGDITSSSEYTEFPYVSTISQSVYNDSVKNTNDAFARLFAKGGTLTLYFNYGEQRITMKLKSAISANYTPLIYAQPTAGPAIIYSYGGQILGTIPEGEPLTFDRPCLMRTPHGTIKYIPIR